MKKTKIRLIDNGQSREIVLDDFQKDTVIIGRGSDCDVRVSNQMVSSNHGCFFKNQGGWGFQDLNSRNGTSMDGASVTTVILKNGNRLYLERNPNKSSTWFDVIIENGSDLDTVTPLRNGMGAAAPMQRGGNGYNQYQPGYVPGMGHPGGYPQGYYQNPYSQPGYSGMAIASMVLGIIGLLMSLSWSILAYPYLVGGMALLSVIFAFVGLASNKKGKGMAVAGLICGLIALIRVIYLWATIESFIDSL